MSKLNKRILQAGLLKKYGAPVTNIEKKEQVVIIEEIKEENLGKTLSNKEKKMIREKFYFLGEVISPSSDINDIKKRSEDIVKTSEEKVLILMNRGNSFKNSFNAFTGFLKKDFEKAFIAEKEHQDTLSYIREDAPVYLEHITGRLLLRASGTTKPNCSYKEGSQAFQVKPIVQEEKYLAVLNFLKENESFTNRF